MILNEFKTFIFNDKDSYEDFGIIVTNMPPIPLPERDISSIQVQGSNRILHIDNGAYKKFDYTIECILKDLSKLDDLRKLFRTEGTIELSILPGRKFNCRNINQIDFENFVNAGVSFPLILEMEPLSYSKEEKTLEFTESSDFIVGGNEQTVMKMTVIGTGEITLNNVSFQILESGITLDTDLQEAYNGFLSKNDKVILDDFPVLNPGENTITLPENMTVTISYNERWL